MVVTIDVDPHGDTLLAFPTANEDGECKLRVSSAGPSLGSSVFRSMFSHRFREGLELGATSSVEVPLPDDDPKAMAILCNVLHHRNDRIPTAAALSAADLLKVAEMSDKYDCAVALQPTARGWLAVFEKRTKIEDRQSMISAAYLFNDDRGFKEFARCIVLQTAGPIWDPATRDDAGPFRKLFECTNQQRKIVTFIESHVGSLLTDRDRDRTALRLMCSPTCAYVEAYTALFLRELKKRDLWPSKLIYERPVEASLIDMRAVEAPSTLRCTPCAGQGNCKCLYAGKSSFEDYIPKFTRQASIIQQQTKQLCLKCYRANGGWKTADCKHQRSTN
ncbi:hypothetical protein LTR85_002950 [Meristemomyces frigidus]|nr:hypothetical protein LTR85_002950 [Meristemomyces frigidus]